MKSSATAALLIVASVAPAFSEPAPAITETQTLFVNTCLLHYTSDQNLPDRFNDKQGYLHLPQEQASKFLDGNAGDVWIFRTETGQYAVALAKNSMCSVYSHSGSASAEWASFGGLIPQLFTPAKRLEDPKMSGHDGTYQSVLYLTERDPVPIVTLTTNESGANSSFAAKISVLWLPKNIALAFHQAINDGK